MVHLVWSKQSSLGAARQSPHDILVRAHAILEEYQLAHLRPTKFKEATDNRWIPPAFPWYKINMDAAVFPQLGMIGVGVIIRDHEGSLVAAMSKRIPLPLGPLEAEAKAMDEATLFARGVGVGDVIFESDSSTICHTLEDPTTTTISISTILSGTRYRLHEFRAFESSHVRRQVNRFAHVLAAYAKDIDFLVTWIEDCPPFIESLVIQDAMLFRIFNKVHVFLINLKKKMFRSL